MALPIPDYQLMLEQLYVAYFNRPADPAGLAYWNAAVARQLAGGASVDGAISMISQAFSKEQEYLDTFAGMNAEQVVNQVYQNLFGRSAEPAGLAYWSLPFSLGKISLAQIVREVAAGAQGTDLTAFNAKAAAAYTFSFALDTPAKVAAYSGDYANSLGKAFLASVDSIDSFALATNAVALDATIGALVQAAPALTLLPGTDDLIGNAGNNVFIGAIDNAAGANRTTLTSADRLAGGAGTDTLYVGIAGTAPAGALNGSALSDIEVLTIHATNPLVTLDLATAPGVGVLNLDRSSAAFIGANMPAGGHYGVIGGGQGVLGFGFADAATSASIDLRGGVTATSINVTGAGLATTTFTSFGKNHVGSITDTSKTGLAIASRTGAFDTGVLSLSDSASILRLQAVGADITTGKVLMHNASPDSLVTITGSNNVLSDFSGVWAPTVHVAGVGKVALGTLNGLTKLVDASAQSAGSLTLTMTHAQSEFLGGDASTTLNVSSASINPAFNISTGAGADTVRVSAPTAVGGLILVGTGAGNDSIALDAFGSNSSLRDGRAVLDGGAGQDKIILGLIPLAEADNVTMRVHAGESSLAAPDSVHGLVLDGAPDLQGTQIDFDGVVSAHAAVASATLAGMPAQQFSYAVSSRGLLTFSGSAAVNLTWEKAAVIAQGLFSDVLDRAVVFTMADATGSVNSYLFEHAAGGDSLVVLVGVAATGIDSAGQLTAGGVQVG